ncbi:MAG TPA: MMPL family transporter [Syntrophorhabdales bacterium]|nr:MMPL family transporter [Syntrophorhabdales bacterium]
MNLVQRLLNKILESQISHPRLFLVGALVLAGISIVYTVIDLQFWTSQRALISQENRLVRLAEEADQFSDFDTFVVAIESHDRRRSVEFLRALVSRLEADHQNFAEVFWRIDPERFKPWALLYPKERDLLSLRDNLKEHDTFVRNLALSPSLLTFFDQVNNEMAQGMVGELFTGFLDKDTEQNTKPMDLEFLIRVLREMKAHLNGQTSFASPWGSFFATGGLDDESGKGYFWTEDKQYLLLFVTPGQAAKGFSRWQAPLAKLRKTIAEVRVAFPGVNVGVTGQKALGEDEMDAALHDMSLATLLSLGGLAVLLVSFWRGIRRPLVEMVALLTALSLTFGFTTLFIGHLNLLSVVFAPMLLGLGIDYGVHWFARYREEQQCNGASIQKALQTTMVRLGPGILLAGFTAALSFFPLVLTGFKGLEELGIICAIGLVMATVATLCLLPALLMLFDKDERRNLADCNQPVKPFLRLERFSASLLVLVAAVTAVLSIWAGRKVEFDLNTLRLQSKRAESVIWEKKLVESSHRPSMYGVLLAHSLEEIKKKTEALEALPTVREVQSVLGLLPSDQEEKIRTLRQIKPLVDGIGPLSAAKQPVDPHRLDEVLGRIRFKMLDSTASQWGVSKPLQTQMREVRGLIDDVRQPLRGTDHLKLQGQLKAFENDLINDLVAKLDLLRKGVEARPMRIEDLPKQLRERYVGQNHLYLIRVFPAQNIWEPDLLKNFVRDLRSVDPDAVGDPVTLSVFTQAFRAACVKAAVYAVIFIFALLIVTFRSLVSTLLALSPLVVGTAWTFGLMYLFRIDLNLANSVFLPLILGAGVEYGIIVVQRWGQGSSDFSGGSCPSSTGIGVVLAGLSTTVGFGSLTISEHQGVHSLGLLTTIGSLSVLAAAVLFLPALLQLIPDRPFRRNNAWCGYSRAIDCNAKEEKST